MLTGWPNRSSVLHTSACTRLRCDGELTLSRPVCISSMAPAQGYKLCACIRPACACVITPTHPSPFAACSHRRIARVTAKKALFQPLLAPGQSMHRWSVVLPNAGSAQLNSTAPTNSPHRVVFQVGVPQPCLAAHPLALRAGRGA